MPWTVFSAKESGLKGLLSDNHGLVRIPSVVHRVGSASPLQWEITLPAVQATPNVCDRILSFATKLWNGPQKQVSRWAPTALCEEYNDTNEDPWALGGKTWELPGGQYGSSKIYTVEVKPLFSAFYPSAFTVTTLRSLLSCYLRAFEALIQQLNDSDDEGDEQAPPRVPIDYVTPAKATMYSIFLEVSITTTRRVLERVVVHYCNSRTAWKLLKDPSKSAVRKAARFEDSFVILSKSAVTAFRAHTLGVAAQWIVALSVDVYTFVLNVQPPPGPVVVVFPDDQPSDQLDDQAEIQTEVQKREVAILLRKQATSTLKAASCLVGAAAGAGIGSVVRPGFGTYIGILVGDFAGQYFAQDYAKKLNRSPSDKDALL